MSVFDQSADEHRSTARTGSRATTQHVLRLGLALSFGPVSHSCARASVAHAPTSLERTVDPSIRPGDDFFSYANGAWIKGTEIPGGRTRWNARDEIEVVTRPRVASLLDDAAAAPVGAPERQVADFRASLLNEVIIEARGVAPFRPQLDSIDRVDDRAALARQLGRGMRADVDPLNWGVFRSASVLGLAVQPSIHGEKHNVAFLVQGGLGLPDREPYLRGDTASIARRAAYRAYVAHLLTFAGVGDVDRRADGVIALETAIARTQTSAEASASDHRADTIWARSDFPREAPGMDWSAYFAAAGLSQQDSIVPWQPSAVRGVATLVAAQSIESWKDYLRVRALDAYADALPRDLAREAAALRDVGTVDESLREARARRAASLTQSAMRDVIARMYAERYFPAMQKARVQRIVSNVVAAFERRVQAAAWMSPESRAHALEKLKALYLGVGYPERWPTDVDIAVDPADAAGNLRRVIDRDRRRALGLLGAPVDMTQWQIAPQTAGAVLVFQQNAYDFAAALMQPPKFDPSASDAACYGAIGAIIGHDVVHFVDVLGAEYEVDGRMHRWWTSADAQQFESVTSPLVKQYSAYHPFADVALDGRLTRTENVADLAGLTAAFGAYRSGLGPKAADSALVRRSDREFFIAFAQSWRTKMSERAMRKQATSDHAPESYRVATVRNLDAWYDAFDVRPGDRLYLAPGERVHIW